MSDLITTIVATVVLVIVIGGIILVTALYWTQIAARLRGKKHNNDNRFATDSEKQQWPQLKSSTDISPVSTPPISPRASQFSEASHIAAPPPTQQPNGQNVNRWQ
jgi:hypothetical protein